MAREGVVDNINDINNNDGEVFPNRGAENNREKGVTVQSLQEGKAEVKRILEHNRMLIKEMGMKYEGRDGGVINHYATLFCEYTKNIERLHHIYSDLSFYFTCSIAKSSSAVVDDATEGSEEARPSQ